MKKIFLILFMFLTVPGVISASNASVSISAPSSVYVGDTVKISVTVSSSDSLGNWNYNISYDDSKFEFVSTDADTAQSVFGEASSGGQTSATNSWTFTAKTSGTASFNVSSISVIAWDDFSEMKIGGTTSTSINIVKPSSPSSGGSGGGSYPTTQYKYSDDNNLGSLNIEGFDISFDSSITEYSVTVPNDTKKVKIGATANDGKASVSGIGEYDVKEGNNDIEVVVTAENGDKKTYKITVVVKELSPIEVNVNDKTFNVVRKKDKLPSANSTYKESSILIKGESVPCYHSDITDIYLIGLMSDKGDISFYRYDASNDKFYSYNEINVSGLFISLVQSENIPSGYNKGIVKIGEKEYDGFVKDDAYSLLYGINLESGEKNFYSYDSIENTLQRFSGDVNSNNKFNCYIVYGLIGLCVFEFIMIIVSVVSKNKQLKKVLRSKLNTRTEYEKTCDTVKDELYSSDDSVTEESYDEENGITNDLTDEYLSTNSAEDNHENSDGNLESSDEVSDVESSVDDTDEYDLGHTALISKNVTNVYDNTKNRKESAKKRKLFNKKKKTDDDDMFKF